MLNKTPSFLMFACIRLIATALLLIAFGVAAEHPRVVVLISADSEWKEVKTLFPGKPYRTQPYGEFFSYRPDVLVVQGGWGKISAAASAQYVIDRWKPATIINLGTCGGFEGSIVAVDFYDTTSVVRVAEELNR